MKKGKEIDAVYFVTESGITERFSPVSFLKSFLKNSKKNAMDALQKGNNSAAASVFDVRFCDSFVLKTIWMSFMRCMLTV